MFLHYDTDCACVCSWMHIYVNSLHVYVCLFPKHFVFSLIEIILAPTCFLPQVICWSRGRHLELWCHTVRIVVWHGEYQRSLVYFHCVLHSCGTTYASQNVRAEDRTLHLGYAAQDRFELCSSPLQNRAECSLHSVAHHLLSGTQNDILEV